MTCKAPITIVMYHSIDPEQAGRHPHRVTPRAFERQIAFLARNYPIMRLSALLTPSAWTIDHRRIIVTFDDGLRDFLKFAYPVLAKHQVPVTMFVPSQSIGKYDVMRASDLLDLERTGSVECGSHTVTHRRMSDLSVDRMRYEACRSKAELEALLGHPILTFSFPFGQRSDFRPAAVRVVEQAGYQLAVTSCWGTTNSPAQPLMLKRIAFDEHDDHDVLRAKIEGAYDWIAFREKAGFVARLGSHWLRAGFRNRRQLAGAN